MGLYSRDPVSDSFDRQQTTGTTVSSIFFIVYMLATCHAHLIVLASVHPKNTW
jgi:hypothetical protein